MPRVYVALDLEFTGLNPEHDAILEVGAVKFRGDEILDTWTCLVNPGRALSVKVERLTGITRADIERAPSFHSLIPSLTRFVGETPIVGHSIFFDMQFLQRGGARLPNPTLDTFELAAILIPYAARYSLAQLARELKIEYPTQHRALQDAQATHRLFIALLERAAQATTELFRERGARLHLQLAQTPSTIRADPDRLTQVVLNLLSNAAKFVPAGAGRVEMRMTTDPQGLTVAVSDNGPGVPVEEQAMVFEKFRQGGESGNRPPGTGLGLAISRSIVEHFGGRIWLESSPGQGACFAFWLPWRASIEAAQGSG